MMDIRTERKEIARKGKGENKRNREMEIEKMKVTTPLVSALSQQCSTTKAVRDADIIAL